MRTTYRLLLLTATGIVAATMVGGPASAASVDRAGVLGAGRPAAPAPVQAAGSGRATPTFVNLRDAAKRPDARTLRQPGVPNRAGTGDMRRPVASGSATAAQTPAAPATMATSAPISTTASAIASSFDGVNEDASTCGCEPSDVNAATNGTQNIEIVNTFMRVFDNSGLVQCGGGSSLNAFLGSTDDVGDPRVQYDNLNARFIFSVAVFPRASGDTPAMYLGASTSSDACGTWIVYRLTFSGGPFASGVTLDYPILGQDRRAFLFGVANFPFGSLSPSGFSVFSVSKADVYGGAAVSFPAFNVASLSAPASNGGIPMIDSPVSYFVSAVPGTGYRLYRMSGSGSTTPSVTLQATIGSSFFAPQRAPQPGTSLTVDAMDGRIEWSPVYDGVRIWFAHGANLTGFPTTVRFGFITPADNGIVTGQAFHNSGTADFNPSVGVGINPNGTETVFVNWAYTDAAHGIATSDAVKSFVYSGGGLPATFGNDETVVTGGATTLEDRFGDYSSVAIDPTVADGSCAVVAQQYFTNQQWSTRLARVCGATPINTTTVPNVLSLPEADAIDLITSAGLVVGTISKDFRCIDPGDVLTQNPSGGVVVLLGTAVNITVSQSTDKNGKPCVIK